MKRYLLIIFFIVSIIACKNDHQDLTSGENKIDFLRAEFEKQTGYEQSQVNLLTPTFRSEVDWSKAIYKGEDTVLVTVRLLDKVIYPINGSEINLKDNVILKAVRNKKLEWSFTTVIFVPTSLAGGYSGLILSRPLSDKAERIRYYNKGSVINSDEVIRIKFANTKGKSQSGSKLRAGCTYAYVNGILNQVTCTPPEKGEREDDPGFGEPGDYFPPGHGGGSGGGTSSPVKKLNKNDPCANKNELNNRKKNSQIKGKNNEIKNLTLQKGLEHGSNAYVNLNNGVVTGFTDVKEGYKTGSGQEVPSVQSWGWLPNNQVEVTADYNHTHPFESGPSSIDVFEGIYPYIATSNSNMDALSPAQKEVYLSYHSINVMTTNHDYAITITDPVKWVSRYPNQVADFEKFQSMFKQYEKSGYIGHTAQELALLELYGDMIQLYRSEVGMNNFEPVISKIDPNTFKKVISKINCN